MGLNEKSTGIAQFAGSNFENWKFRVERHLSSVGCIKAVMESAPTVAAEIPAFMKLDAKAQDVIVSFIHDDYIEYVRGKDTAKGMWDSLCATFEKKSAQNQTLVRKELAKLRLREGEDMNKHLLKFDSLIRQLKSAGAKPEEADLVSQLFLTLPESYDAVVTALENLPNEELTVSIVKQRLLAEESKKKQRTSEIVEEKITAFATKKKKAKFNGKCHKCGRYGHMKKDCRVKEANVAVVPSVSFMADSNQHSKVKKDELVSFALDSGATDHFVNDVNMFSKIKNLAEPRYISVAKNDEHVVAKKIGDIECVSNANVTMNLKDGLYSPDFRENLLSVSRIVDADVDVYFTKDRAELLKDGNVIATGKRSGNLFEVKFKILRSVSNLSKTETETLWHRRMGHISKQSYSDMIKHNMVTGIPNQIPNNFCEVCTQSRQSREPFDGTRSRATRPIEHIHSDVCGPIGPVAYDGSKYFVTFIDDYTHFAHVYLIKHKSEVFDKFKEFNALVNAKFGTNISILTIDQGREYKSKEMIMYCKEKGIQIAETIAYSPQQNGVAERFNRTVVEKARALMIEAGIPKSLWGDAVYTSTYLINRSPTKALMCNKTPAEMWSNEKPDLTKLRVFGCSVYAWIPNQKRKKLDAKSNNYVMVGYCPNGYRLWDKKNRTVILARDCKFDESNYPYKKVENNVPNLQTIYRDNEDNGNTVDTVEEPNEQEGETDSGVVSVDLEEEPIINTSSDEIVQPVIEDELRRGTRERKPPSRFTELYESIFKAVCNDDIPNSYSEIENSTNRDKWLEAVKSELDSMEKNKVWNIVKKPDNKKLLKSRWVFVIKTDANGSPVRFKARLVAKGFLQKFGVDYEETYSPVAKLSTLRTVLAVGVRRGYTFYQLDVKTAFLHGELKEDIYLEVPEGMNTNPGMSLKLVKSLYGLKQSPRCWNQKVNMVLEGLGFKRSQHDYCLYTKNNNGNVMLLLLYVDDVLIAGNDLNDIERVKKKLSSVFDMSDCGELQYYLGMKIEYNKQMGCMYLSQEASIVKILEKFGMTDCNTIDTPMEKGLQLPRTEEESSKHPYRELLGSLMYLMLCVRPDICYAVGYMGRYQENFAEIHWSALKRILRYLKGTKSLKLKFDNACEDKDVLVGFVDADWASNTDDRKSTSGYIYYVYGCPVSWSSKKQTTVATSSSEAEYVALSLATSEGLWLKGILEDMDVMTTDEPFLLYEDNAGCIAMAKSAETKRSKHIDIKHHFIRDHVLKGDLKIQHISTKDQVADVFTKALDKRSFDSIRNLLKLYN